MMRTVNQQEFDGLVERVRAIRSSPDYVPEFPPSRLIDDTPEGVVRACYRVEPQKTSKE